MRDHKKLEAFHLADDLTFAIYRETVDFPRHEQFGLTAQLRKGAVRVASNIVEGSARRSQSEYVRFLDMALASTRELEYQVSVATRLGYLEQARGEGVARLANRLARALHGVIAALSRTRPRNY